MRRKVGSRTFVKYSWRYCYKCRRHAQHKVEEDSGRSNGKRRFVYTCLLCVLRGPGNG